jgi:YidC/Oxa1 family membrane protein insertase
VAFDESYFMGAIFPRFAEGTSCTLYEDPSGVREATLEIDLGTLAAGQTATRELGLYLGPKLFDELKRVSEENVLGAPLTALGQSPKPASAVSAGFDPELSSAIDFRVWLFFFRPDFAVICRVLLWIMRLFHDLFVNWGIAIILLTVVVKALLYPLSHKQMEPQLQALEKKYKEDKEKLNLEKMKLFQENKVNPFGGCLPLLIQMPVWVALYSTLLASFELYREPLIGFWIKDLTLHDPYYVLPIAMGLTMFITQKMQPQMGDAAQAKMMLYFMPILFTFFMLSLPAGLTLYIFTNNLLSIAQQKVLQHRFAKKAAR